MKNKLPIFFAVPRSRSTALMTLAGPYMTDILRLIPLGDQTEFFQEWSHRYFCKDTKRDVETRMEYFPLNRENAPITHHFVSPPIYNDKLQRISHKIQVLKHEKKVGRNYNIKIMSEDIVSSQVNDNRFDRSILDFFSDRKFVITRRKDIKGLALSLILSIQTNLWHKRSSNTGKWDELENNQIFINPELCTMLRPILRSVALMDKFENELERSGYQYQTVYYEDMTTLEDMKVVLDQVFDTTTWRDTLSDSYIESALPKNLGIDYKSVISNYDEVADRIDMIIREIFG